MGMLSPTLNLLCNVWRGPPSVPGLGPPDVVSACNLCPGRRSPIGSAAGYLDTWLLLPPRADVRSGICAGGPDLVEVPAGSGRYYAVAFVDDVHRGFPHEFRFALLTQLPPWSPSTGGVLTLALVAFGLGDQSVSQAAEVGGRGDGTFEFDVWASGSFQTLVSTSALVLLSWYHLAFTFDGTTSAIYVNGRLDAQRLCSPPTIPALPGIFWNYLLPGDYGDGSYSAVRTYSSALTAAEVLDDARGTIQAGAVATYPCTEGTGTVVHDTTGAFDGTLVNAPAWDMTAPGGGGVYLARALSQRCDCPDTISTLPTWSLTFWFKPAPV